MSTTAMENSTPPPKMPKKKKKKALLYAMCGPLVLFMGMVGILTLGSASSGSAASPPVLLLVTKTADTNDGSCDTDCSLREAISEANKDGFSDTIVFSSGLSGSIVLKSGLGGLTIANDPDPTVTSDLSINGPGAKVLSVSGNDAVRPFKLDAGPMPPSGGSRSYTAMPPRGVAVSLLTREPSQPSPSTTRS